MHERIEQFRELLEKELKEELDDIIRAGDISPDEVCTVKDAVKLMLKLNEYEEWENGGSRSYDNRSYGRRSYDRMGDRRSYRSRRSYDDGMVSKLQKMYNEAKSEDERRMIDEWISRAEMEER